MSSLITLLNVSYSAGNGQSIISDISLNFGRECTGLIGRNGIGKSTLLKLISGELAPNSGTILRDGSCAVLRQIVQPDGQENIADLFGVRNALASMQRIIAGSGDDADMEAADWTLESRIAAALDLVGLRGTSPDHLLAALSGGQRTRVALAALEFAAPDMILLDEPTNNLDAAGRDAVIRFLSTWRGGAIIISHDRALLRHMDRIVELTSLGAKSYGGNWDFFEDRKAEEQAAAEQKLLSTERKIRLVDRQIQEAREKKAKRDSVGERSAAKGGMPKILLGARKQRAEESGGREQMLATAQRADAHADYADAQAQVEIYRSLDFAIPPSGLAPGRVLLKLENITGGPAPGVIPIRDFSMAMTGPERVAISGINGSGKSTVLAMIAGHIMPLSGRMSCTARMAMLDQQVALLDPNTSIFDNYRRINPGETDNGCHAALARFLFRNQAAYQLAGTLSGGEMIRAGLACVLGSQPPELLLLDEPTNHLDIASTRAVEAALQGYDGAILVVSHDPDFLSAIGVTRMIHL